jgi:chorismate synthase
MAIEIKPISTYEGYKAAEQLQAEVLGFGPLDVVPYQILQSFAQSGGAVIGAYADMAAADAGTQTLIGVVMGYTGLLPDGTPYHRSQRMAVLAQYRGQGVGAALKHAQADLARSRGLRLMCWTFDPLRALNAHLNLHKLGVISRRYIANAYYASTSPRDAGAPIDRLWVEWDLALRESREPHERPAYTLPASPVKVIRLMGDRPSDPDLSSDAPAVLIQIPTNIDAVRDQGLDRLLEWRMATRAAFERYLAAGYVIADFQREQGYVLVRG